MALDRRLIPAEENSTPVSLETRTQDHATRHLRELLVDGEPVSRLSVLDRNVRLLGCEVRTGGIGGVRTRQEHRRKGYARRLLEDTVDYMTREGYAISMLFGIPDFYHRFGFLSAMAEHCTVVSTRDAERAGEVDVSCIIRPLCDDDLPFTVHLYNQVEEFRAGTICRSPSGFDGFSRGTGWEQETEAFIVEDSRGEPAAYVAHDRSSTAVKATEVNATDARFFWPITRRLARMAVERRCGELEVHVPYDHPFARFLRRFGCRTRVDYPRMGGGMARILNQEDLFADLAPGMAARLKSGPLADRPLQLRIATDLGASELRLNSGADGPPIRAGISLTQDLLTQILLGYREADDALGAGDVQAEGEAARVLHVLFADQVPYVYYADRF
jgi:GNAT superfamily N-acetyltransferase